MVVTLKDVAGRAGVSIKTVSRIVNGDVAVNAKTRAAVQKHLDELNYVPDPAARLMRKGVSSTYGLMTDVVLTTPYSFDIVRGVQAGLAARGQTLLIANTDDDAARESLLWRMFQAHRVAGVIYASMHHREHFLAGNAPKQHLVLANCFSSNGQAAGIVPDDEAGGYLQARHLLQLGHRRIGLISLLPGLVAARLRHDGIERAFAEAGVAVDGSLVVAGFTGAVRQEKIVAYDAARAMLARPDRPTAIICGTDQVAMQVYAAAANLGLAIPQDLSVIGFDDFRLIAETLTPALTTVALPYYDIGLKAVELINGKDAVSGKIALPCLLVERQSCRSLA